MRIRLTLTLAVAVCGLMVAAGCYNAPVEKLHAKRAMRAGDYATATQKLQGVVEYDPADWEGHFLLGQAYLGQGRAIEAQSELELALAAKDRSSTHTPKILDALAESLLKQEQYEELYAFLDFQIERYQGWEDYARKARYLLKAGDIDGAALAYKQAAFFSRDEDADIYIEIADFYRERADQENELLALRWAYYIDNERTDLRPRFESLGYIFGPTLKERPPQPMYDGNDYKLPRLIGE